ncbi:hypothetical protein GKR75_01195 [Providencia sp. wls1919]|nr:hypothetical protein [Providencia sp. wls1919]
MNYQVVPSWLYSGKIAFLILFAFALGFLDMNAFAFYLLFMGIAWQLFISLNIHSLKEKYLILKDSDITNWLVYIYGIPVKEIRKELKNPNFAIEKQAVNFFLWRFIAKGGVQLFFTILLIFQYISSRSSEVLGINILSIILLTVAVLFLCYSLFNTIKNIICIKHGKQVIATLVSPSSSQWYQIHFTYGDKMLVPALSRLLSI